MALGDRWSFYIGAVLLVSLGMHWSQYSDVKVISGAKVWLVILFIFNAFLISWGWAYVPEYAREDSIDYLKWFLVYIAIIKTHSNRAWLPVVLYIYILSAIYMGWEQTWFPRGSRAEGIGTSTTFEENFMAAHVVTLVPLAGAFILCSEVSQKLRLIFLLGTPFMLNLFVALNSRGSMVGLGVVALLSPILFRGKYRWFVILALLMGSLLSLRLVNDKFWERFDTIESYEEDASAMGRVYAWKAAWKLAKKQPLGYGSEAFDHGLGEPLMPLGFHTTHNMFFEILVAWGIQGVILFYGAILLSIWECIKIRRHLWDKNATDQSRGYLEATGCILALVAMLVTTIFINRVRWEMWWVMMAYTTCLSNTYLRGFGSRAANQDSDQHSTTLAA